MTGILNGTDSQSLGKHNENAEINARERIFDLKAIEGHLASRIVFTASNHLYMHFTQMVDSNDQPKEISTSTKETEEPKDVKTSPAPPKQVVAPPTPVVLQALLVSDKKEEKKKESISQVRCIYMLI